MVSTLFSKLNEMLNDNNSKKVDQILNSLPKYLATNKKDKFDKGIRALAIKLLFTESYLKSIFYTKDTADFNRFIMRRWERGEGYLNLAKEHYKNISSNYQINNDFAHGEITIQVNGLMQAVKKCTKVFHNNPSKDNFYVYMKKLDWHLLTKKIDRSLLIVRWSGNAYEKKTIPINGLKVSNPNFLGKGGFSRVQKVFNITNGRWEALKIALPSSTQRLCVAIENLTNEFQKLNYIHQNKLQIGIKESPHVFFNIEGEMNICAYLEKIYNMGDLEKALCSRMLDPTLISKEVILSLAENLIIGLIILHSDNVPDESIIHGDLKIENVFAEKDDRNNFNLVIGDLGGSKFLKTEFHFNDPDFVNMPFGTITTQRSYTLLDSERLMEAIENNDIETWNKYVKIKDIFALGIILWNLFSGEEPYLRTQNVKWAETEAYPQGEGFITSKYGIDVVEILKLTIHENPDIRPSKEELLKVIQTEKNLLNKKRQPIHL